MSNSVISVAVLGTFVPAGLPFAFYVCNRPVRCHLSRTLSGQLSSGRIIGNQVPGDENWTNDPGPGTSRALGRHRQAGARPFFFDTKGSLVNVSKRRATSICASGKVASVSPATAVAVVATSAEPLAYAGLEWAVAAGYLLFDAVFSPRSGDLMRAKLFLRE